VTEIQLDAGGLAAWIACPAEAIPCAGQYTLAFDPEDEQEPLATPILPAAISPDGFLAASPVPRGWSPGMTLRLRGPLGQGFSLRPASRNVALIALGATAARLMPLVPAALGQGAAVALFTDVPLPQLPSAVEAYPLSSLPELLNWADFMAIDLPNTALPELHLRIGVGSQGGSGHELPLHCPAQVLVLAPMPCGGSAECGVCAVPARRGWKLACVDGPVFDFNEIR